MIITWIGGKLLYLLPIPLIFTELKGEKGESEGGKKKLRKWWGGGGEEDEKDLISNIGTPEIIEEQIDQHDNQKNCLL